MDFGALNKKTGQYVLPSKATKRDKYKCPDCNKDLILCKGKIRRPYFRHKVDNQPCQYYTSPSESQIHKDAKYRLKYLLETKDVTIVRYCQNCNSNKEHIIPELIDVSKIIIEYRFEYKGSVKSCDVCYLDDGKINSIFEICYKHKTKPENRPEPWFELDAKNIVNTSESEEKEIELKCIRDEKCSDCIYMEDLKINDLEKYVRIKLGQDFKNPTYISYGKQINQEEYDLISKKEQDYFKINHKRIDVSASRCSDRHCICFGKDGHPSCNEDIYQNNKEICDIFKNDFNSNRVVIYVWKGSCMAYIITKHDYQNHDYWNKNNWENGVNGELKYPYLFRGDSDDYLGKGTIGFLMDLINKAKDLIPKNKCRYKNRSDYFDEIPDYIKEMFEKCGCYKNDKL